MTHLTVALPILHQGRAEAERLALDKGWGSGEEYDVGGQQGVIDRGERHNIIYAGRRWGKSYLVSYLCLETALEGKIAWWIWPSQSDAAYAWRFLKEIVGDLPVEIKEVGKTIDFGNGGMIIIKSAHEPDDMRGQPVDLAVIDEAAYTPKAEYLFEDVLFPTIMERSGRFCIISTPNDLDWMWKIWSTADLRKGWAAWRFPTWDNPGIELTELEHLRETVSTRTWEVEICCKFLPSEHRVFKNIEACMTVSALTPEETGGMEGVRTAGLDFARVNDWLVMSVMIENRQVHLDRMRQAGWPVMLAKCVSSMVGYDVKRVRVDSTGMGDPLVTMLEDEIMDQGAGVEVVPYTYSGKAKQRLIEEYVIATEREEVILIEDKISLEEHRRFTGKLNRATLTVRYEAEGGNDDIVNATALNFMEVRHGTALIMEA